MNRNHYYYLIIVQPLSRWQSFAVPLHFSPGNLVILSDSITPVFIHLLDVQLHLILSDSERKTLLGRLVFLLIDSQLQVMQAMFTSFLNTISSS